MKEDVNAEKMDHVWYRIADTNIYICNGDGYHWHHDTDSGLGIIKIGGNIPYERLVEWNEGGYRGGVDEDLDF